MKCPKGHFRLAMWSPRLPSPPFPGILGEVAAWPRQPQVFQWVERGSELWGSEPDTPSLHTPDPVRSLCSQHVLRDYFYCIQLMLLAG